jgi:hypothetical protein
MQKILDQPHLEKFASSGEQPGCESFRKVASARVLLTATMLGNLNNLIADVTAYRRLGKWMAENADAFSKGSDAFILVWKGYEQIRNRWGGPPTIYLEDARAEIAAINNL